jgi:hypothetical protein
MRRADEWKMLDEKQIAGNLFGINTSEAMQVSKVGVIASRVL